MKRFLCFVAAIWMLMCVTALASSPVIPVVSLDGDCLIDYSNWNDKETYYPATLGFVDGNQSFTKDIEIKPQGTTSLYAPKKNFTVKFSEGVEFVDAWGTQKKYVLKADYIDPTCSGNVVSAKLAAEMNQKYGIMADTPNYGVIDGFPVWVRINGENAGIFNLTIPKDAWMFGMDEDNPNHLVLACEGWTPACRMQTAEIDYEKDWAFEVGEPTDESKAAFERMVAFVSTADDQTFVRDFEQYLNLDACLNYICFINTAYGSDNVAKNMLMATYDGKIWYPVLYDLDSLWGIGFDGTALAAANGQWSKDLLTDANQLLYRVKHLFGDQVRERYWELREGILSKEHIMESFEAYTAQIPQEYYVTNNALWYADGSRIRTLELMSQLMDEYLPIVDGHFAAEAEIEAAAAAQNAPAMHYVWEADGVLKSSEDIDALPVGMTLSYTLDGNAISAQELAGRSGQLEATLRVERRAAAEHVYAVTALVHAEAAQCQNLTVTGGTCTNTEQAYACMGGALLGGTDNVYEMQLRMDVTEFDPAAYVVTVCPVYVDGGGDDGSLTALLATAGELSTVINEGILLHESMLEFYNYLTTIQSGLAGTGASVQALLPSDAEAGQTDADSIMKSLLADAEADADAMLTAFGYEVAADAASDARVQMLSGAAEDAARTEEEKAQALKQLGLIENYLAVIRHLEETEQAVGEINASLTEITTTLPDLVGAYAYANDSLYAILYKVSTLYQNLENYYFAHHGDGDAFDSVEFGDWYDVIVFSNHEEFSAR